MNNIREKAKKIKCLIFDIDGVLTDGGIIYDGTLQEIKKFNVKDGFIVAPLRELGFIVGAISGRKSAVAKHRCKELKLDFFYLASKNKGVDLEEVKQKYGLLDEQIAFIGDDLIDLPILLRCGLSVCPADSIEYVTKNVDWVTKAQGGQGAFREMADFIIDSQGFTEKLIQKFSAIS